MEPRYERITIEPDQKGNFLRDTLLHEVLHACLFAAAGGMTTDEEERLVASLTPVLLDTLRRNPGLLAFLTDA